MTQHHSRMNQMTVLLLALLLFVGATLTGCSSDADDTEAPAGMEAGKTYFMSVDATKSADASPSPTRALSLSGSTLSGSWSRTDGEKVYVKYNNEWFSGSLQPNTDAATAKLNGAITAVSTVPSPALLHLQFPRQQWTYAGQLGTIDDIARNFDYSTASTNITIDGSNVDAASSVTFVNGQAVVKFVLTDGTNPVCPTSLRIAASGLKSGEEAMDDVTITPAGNTNEVFAALRGVTGNIILTAYTADKIYSYRKTAVTFEHGKYYEVTLPMKEKAYPVALPEVTPHYVGSVVCTDGTVYETATAASAAGRTPVAMIASVSSTGHGIALALNDESAQTLAEAQSVTTSEESAVTGATGWQLPTVADWRAIFIASGNDASDSDASTAVSFAALKSRLSRAGGTELKSTDYWAYDVEGYYDVYYSLVFGEEKATFSNSALDDIQKNVRACLKF